MVKWGVLFEVLIEFFKCYLDKIQFQMFKLTDYMVVLQQKNV
jgi:hypothetical protein